MHPQLRELAAAAGLGLGNLVLVVGEDEIHAATVDVQGKPGAGHGGTLYVPAGTPLAPGAFPVGLAWLGSLPQGKVHGILLFLAWGYARACLHVVQIPVGELAVVGKGADPEVDVAGRSGIGLVLADELLAHVHDVLHVFGCPWLYVRAQDTQCVHVLVEGLDVGLGHFLPVPVLAVCAIDDLVVHVREVAHHGDFKALAAQVAHKNVKDQG